MFALRNQVFATKSQRHKISNSLFLKEKITLCALVPLWLIQVFNVYILMKRSTSHWSIANAEQQGFNLMTNDQ